MILVLTSCTDIIEGIVPAEDYNVSFTLVNSELKTRAEEGVTDYNENLITKADIFLYADPAANALCKLTWKGSAETTATVNATLTKEQLDALFGPNAASGTCTGYAVVNGPDTPDSGDGTKISALKALGIGGSSEFSVFPSACFVMDGQNNAISYDGNKLTGNIDLDRAASKIQLYIPNDKLTNYIDDAGNQWVPQTTGMAVSFHNGVYSSRVDVVDANDRTDDNYYSLSDNPEGTADDERFAMTATDGTYTHQPFYSYSSDWGRDEDPDQEPYLTLRVYWQKQVMQNGTYTNSGAPEAYYYRVPINLNGRKLDRNTWYKINLEVGVLGDKPGEKPTVELTPQYIIVDWSTLSLDASLADYHYLVVEKDFFEMYNTEELTFTYEACDAVSVRIVSMTVPDFSTNTIGVIEYNDENAANLQNLRTNEDGKSTINRSSCMLINLLNACSVSMDTDNKTITLSHALQNDNSQDKYDHAIYTIELEVKTACGLSETVIIKQYPARYIEGFNVTNPNHSDIGTVIINGYGGRYQSNGDSRGAALASSNHNIGYKGGGAATNAWHYANNSLKGSGYNANANIYIINVSSFDNTQADYIIADPRSSTIKEFPTVDADAGISGTNLTGVRVLANNNDSPWIQAPALYGTTPRRLEYYYATRTDNENLIAPRFIVSSAYGRFSGGDPRNKDEVIARCAAYQENGYPAGRWRIPTTAELRYIAELNAAGIIPSLFNPDAGNGYHSATQFLDIDPGKVTIINPRSYENSSVRCVYDLWYWGDDKLPEDQYMTFWWGDKPR